ncbi:hypothetical protein HY994_05465 [Candidatus Micrarchaeota archaeon]|nr:hypothetical protein [Candidatus Micrarchaeota archaeon]
MLKTALLQRFSQDELDDAVLRKQDQFAGLLTEEAAIRVVAHENGVLAPADAFVFSPLSSAQMGQMLSAQVRVLHVFSPKRFENAARSGRLCKLRVADASGSADLVLWNSEVDIASKIQRNAVVNLKDVVVKVLHPLELHSRLSSEITVVPEQTASAPLKLFEANSDRTTLVDSPFPASDGALAFSSVPLASDAASLTASVAIAALPSEPALPLPPLPLASTPIRTLSELREGEETDVFARVVEKQPLKEFKRMDKTGYLSKIKLADGAASMWAACWDENARLAQELDVGDAVKVEGAVLKNGELSVSWSGRFLKNPENHALAAVEGTPVKSLAALDGAEALVEAKIDKVIDAQRVHKCKSCGTKSAERKAVCTCGSEDFSDLTYASLELSDASGKFRAVLFDSAAEAFLGAKPVTDLSLLASLKRDYLAGKSVTLLAYAKTSSVSGQKEIVGKAVMAIR